MIFFKYEQFVIVSTLKNIPIFIYKTNISHKTDWKQDGKKYDL